MRRKRWAVFLDRDGTLLPDAGHATRPEQLVLYPGAGEALVSLREAGAKLVVVSNQSAIARGWLDDAGLARMDRRLRSLVRAEGARLDATFYCPHHPRYTGPCSCRKPEPGMIRNGLRRFDLDPGNCFLVGDTRSDMEAGRRAGLRTVLVLTGYGRRARREVLRRKLADKITRNLAGAARWILEKN